MIAIQINFNSAKVARAKKTQDQPDKSPLPNRTTNQTKRAAGQKAKEEIVQ